MTRLRFLPLRRWRALAAHASRAQTFPTNDPVIKRIYAIGMDSTHLYTEAHVALRLARAAPDGHAEHQARAGLAHRACTSRGASTPRKRSTAPGAAGSAAIRISTWSSRASARSRDRWWATRPGTNGKPVTLSTDHPAAFKDSTEFVKWLPQARGKLVMISAPMPTCRSQEQWNAFGTPESAGEAGGRCRRQPHGQGWTGRNVRGTGYSAALGGGELGVRLEQGGAGGIITSRPKLAYTVRPRRPGAAARRRRRWRGGGGGGRGGPPATVPMTSTSPTAPPPSTARRLRAAIAAAGGRGRGSEGGVGAMEVFETYNTKTPAIALNCEDYGLVYRLTDKGDHRRSASTCEGKLLGEQPVFNVVAMVKG